MLQTKYTSVVICNCDNVGSAHLQKLRKALRPLNATMVFGKNTLMKRCLNQLTDDNANLSNIVPYIKGNVGFIFCENSKLSDVVEICNTNRVGAAAKPGTIAPKDVTVPAGPTGMEPTVKIFFLKKTFFFNFFFFFF